MRTLRKFKYASFALMAVMVWVYGGLRVHAENYVADSKRPVTLAAPSDHFDTLLSEIKDLVSQSIAKTKSAPEKGFENIEKLMALKASLAKEHEKSREYFDSVQKLIEQKKLPEEILRRHREFVEQYETKYEALLGNLEGIESAHSRTTGFWGRVTGASKKVDWEGVIGKTLAFLEKETLSPAKSRIDPNNLPHRSLKADKPNPPKLTSEEWAKAFSKEAAEAGAAPGKKSGPIAFAATSQPTPADLEETIEVKFTPEIRQLADSLEKNPVKIFNWVRNNIEFVPTWGSIQGAELCLENRAGNAFDTASLLIALLRYAGIPARYQMGTIEVPINKAMSWLGGVTEPKAASLLLSSGGVPSEVITNQGTFVKIRLEHAWVKASLDYIPSRGGVNAQADSWVEIDPSFKQYTVVEGLDLSSQVAFQRDQYLNSPSTVSPMDHYLQQVQNYLSSNLPGKTLDDVLRKESIVRREYSVLAVALPYALVIKGQEFSVVPNGLRQTIRFEAFSDRFLRDPDFSYTTSLPELSGKRVTLSYAPTDPSVAQSFGGMYFTPPYLVRLRPVLRVDGAVSAQGQTAGRLMGETQLFSISLNLPGIPGEEVIDNELTVGGYHAIVLNPQKVTQGAVDKISARQIEAEDKRLYGTVNIDNADRDALYGSILNWLGLLYFQRLDQIKQQAAALYKVRYLNKTYLGMFAIDLSVRSIFGRPAGVAIDRLTMDVDRIVDAPISVRDDQTAATQFTIITGFHSSFLEHSIFDVDIFARGFSAVKALQQARAEGIPTFDINADNILSILPQLSVPNEVRETILDNVNRGRVVTISQRDVGIGAINGIGYTVIDPQTGDGSYLISIPNLLSGGETKYLLHGLAGGQTVYSIPTDPCVNGNRPIAILIMGSGSAGDWMAGLSWGFLEGAGNIFHANGYDVVMAKVTTKDEFLNTIRQVGPFVYETVAVNTLCQPNNTNIKRKNVFVYVGHATQSDRDPSLNGSSLSIDPSNEDLGQGRVRPGDVSAVNGAFSVVYLSGCNTGPARSAWAGAFSADALVGHGDTIGTGNATGNDKDVGFVRCFALGLIAGETVGNSMGCLLRSPYLEGNPNTRVK